MGPDPLAEAQARPSRGSLEVERRGARADPVFRVRVLACLLRAAFDPSPTLDTRERLVGWSAWTGVSLHLTPRWTSTSVSIGHTLIDNRQGVVTRMTGRYVVVRSLDGNEANIPNETILTSTVINQSCSDRKVRIAVPIRIADAITCAPNCIGPCGRRSGNTGYASPTPSARSASSVRNCQPRAPPHTRLRVRPGTRWRPTYRQSKRMSQAFENTRLRSRA